MTDKLKGKAKEKGRQKSWLNVIKPQRSSQQNTTRALGEEKEQQAENYLAMRGLKPLARNFYCKLGEIDLIMHDGDYLVFVEVRYRKSTVFGYASETIDHRKQAKLLRTAEFYLQQKNLTHAQACRFDTLCIQGQGRQQTFDWVKNAFA